MAAFAFHLSVSAVPLGSAILVVSDTPTCRRGRNQRSVEWYQQQLDTREGKIRRNKGPVGQTRNYLPQFPVIIDVEDEDEDDGLEFDFRWSGDEF